MPLLIVKNKEDGVGLSDGLIVISCQDQVVLEEDQLGQLNKCECMWAYTHHTYTWVNIY